MDTFSAYCMAQAHRGKPRRVFDWDKAAELIRLNNPQEACAGLCGDWETTGGVIFQNGKPVTDDYTYLMSNWAIPELVIDKEIVECWRFEKDAPEWDAETKWPESALKILNGGQP